MADINAFLGRVMRGGFQRTNQYRCKLDLPAQFGNFAGQSEAAQLLREGLLCRTTMTPSRTLETTTVNLAGGYEEEYAIGTTYNNLDCTFLCPLIDGTNQVLTLFHAWQNLIQPRGKFGEDADMVLRFPKTYRLEQGMRLEVFTGHMTQSVFDPDFVGPSKNLGYDSPKPEITTAFEYFDVYPVTVSGTTVDWITVDEMMEVAVNFSYTHWQQVKDEDLNQ
jgi:hypothetical protein